MVSHLGSGENVLEVWLYSSSPPTSAPATPTLQQEVPPTLQKWKGSCPHSVTAQQTPSLLSATLCFLNTTPSLRGSREGSSLLADHTLQPSLDTPQPFLLPGDCPHLSVLFLSPGQLSHSPQASSLPRSCSCFTEKREAAGREGAQPLRPELRSPCKQDLHAGVTSLAPSPPGPALPTA